MAGPVPDARTGGMVGRVLEGRYRITGRLGAGASAVVYAADDVRLRRGVAVKILHSALAADPAFLRQFEAEAQIAAGLRHPNLLAVHDWGEEDGLAYLVTEHLEGGSLRDLLDRGFRASPSQALLLGLQAARALDHAHRRGLVHRDIKPANLLFDADGRLRVADFGLARAIAEAAITEPMGALLGTAKYASPEQAEGRPLDGRSDVYSLGLVLIEMLTGRVPFVAETSASTLMARVGRAVTPPPEAGALTDVLMAVGRPKPVDRPDAATFGQLLKACSANLPPPAPIPLARPTSVAATRAASAPADLTALAARQRPEDGESSVRLPPPKPIPPRPADERPFDAEVEVEADQPEPATDGRRRVVIDDGDEGSLLAMGESAGSEVEAPRRRRGRRIVLIVALVLLLGGGGAAAAVTKPWLSTVDVPVVDGATLDAARARLAAQHLRAVPGPREPDENVPEGRVLRAAKTRAREESTVLLVISSGPAPRKVPATKGLPAAEAQARLTALQLASEVVTKDDEVAPAGTVLSTTPAEGEDAARDSKVTITVSDGPAPRPVPDLGGKPYDEAAAALAALGFAPTRTEAFSDTVPPGTVMGTTPPSGTALKPGKPVAVTVSKGPDLVAVPAVSGKSPGDAQDALKAVGLSVSATFGPPSGKVFETDPKQGTKVKRGSAVALYTR